MKLAYPHIAGRIFNEPLLIHEEKAAVIVHALEPRLLGQGKPHASEGDDQEQERGFDVHDGIAVIRITGTLINRGSWMSAWSGMRSYGQLREAVEDAATDPQIRGILLDIDSPGGEAAGLFDLVDFLYNARALKPLWAIANDDAYSAAYGIASAAEKIYVTRTSGVGSVGVIALHLDHSEADEREGLKYTIFRGGKFKAEHNTYEPLTDHATQTLQAEIDRLHQLFAETVARNRALSVNAVLATEAQTYHGPHGIEIGFADRLGTLEDALAAMQRAVDPAPVQVGFTLDAVPDQETLQRVVEEAILPTLQEKSKEGIAIVTPRGTAAHKHPSHEEDTMAENTTASAETAQETAESQGQVIDLEQHRASARLEERAYQKKLRGLCQMAGKPDLAEAFIEKDLTAAIVSERLLELRAQEDEAVQINAQTDPHPTRPPKALNGSEVYDTLNQPYRQALAGVRD